MKVVTELLRRGITLTRINTEVIAEQIASAMYHPNIIMRIDDAITPTLPRRSANI